MSLLNRPNHGFPSCLVVIYRLLISKGQLTSEQISTLCDPPTLKDKSQGSVRKTVNTWCKLGLFHKTENEVTIAAEIPESERSLENLSNLVRDVVLSEENNPVGQFFDSDGVQSLDFVRLLAWSLAQDIWVVQQAGFNGVFDLLKQQLPDIPPLCSQSIPWDGFKSWARFMGFAWSPSHPPGTIEPDPTLAIRETLPRILTPKETLEARAFLDRIAEAIPVLDGGRYRRIIEGELAKNSGEHAWRKLREDQVSTALSRALLRMQEEEIVTLESRDDSTGTQLSLTGPDNSVIEKISHIKYISTSSEI